MLSWLETTIFAGALIAFWGCAPVGSGGGPVDTDYLPAETGADDTAAAEACTDLYYESFGVAFMRDWCTGCHSSALGAGQREGAPASVDLDSLADVRAHADRIAARASVDDPSMPPVGGGDLEERERLAEWLACGAPSLTDKKSRR